MHAVGAAQDLQTNSSSRSSSIPSNTAAASNEVTHLTNFRDSFAPSQPVLLVHPSFRPGISLLIL